MRVGAGTYMYVLIHTCMYLYIHVCMHIYMCVWLFVCWCACVHIYDVMTISRLLRIIGLFCRI